MVSDMLRILCIHTSNHHTDLSHSTVTYDDTLDRLHGCLDWMRTQIEKEEERQVSMEGFGAKRSTSVAAQQVDRAGCRSQPHSSTPIGNARSAAALLREPG